MIVRVRVRVRISWLPLGTHVDHGHQSDHSETTQSMRGGGVGPDLIRLSVGLEDIEDILWDLDQALTKAVDD